MARSRQKSASESSRRLEVRRLGKPREPLDVRAPALPWPFAVILSAIGGAAAGWLLVAAPAVVATLTGPTRAISGGFAFATEFWLLAHGAGADIGGTTITLMPLGLSALFVLILSGLSGVAARQAVLALEPDEFTGELRTRLLSKLVLSFTLAYLVTVGVVAFLLTTPTQVAKALLGSAVLAGVSSLVGVGRAVGWNPTRSWPRWARRVPMAAGAGIATVLAGGSAALVVALYQGRERIAELATSLGADPVGGVVLVLGQVAYIPNVVLWAASWVLGAGVTIGDGSVISPTATHVGLLPAVPILGAVPSQTSGSGVLALWLVVGVAAGVAAAWVAVEPQRRARVDETSLVGGLAGVAAGVALTVVAVLSRGDLGVARLVGVGPRPLELFVMGCSLLGISGMAAGLVIGLLARPAGGRQVPAEQVAKGSSAEVGGPDDEETAPVG